MYEEEQRAAALAAEEAARLEAEHAAFAGHTWTPPAGNLYGI
jgi:hypothetical protein